MHPHRHFLLTNGRSGSNFFVQALNQHPSLVNYGEVLGDWTVPGRRILPRFADRGGAAAYVDWMLESHFALWAAQIYSLKERLRQSKRPHFRLPGRVASVGIKEFAVNLRRHGLRNYLSERPDIRLISLVRDNPIDRLLSVLALAQTGVVANTSKSIRSRQIRLEIRTLVDDLDVIEDENATVRRMADEHQGPVYRLVYEQFFAQSDCERNRTLRELLDFLDLPDTPLKCEHRKLRQASLRDTIVNYDEVASQLANTRYAIWL